VFVHPLSAVVLLPPPLCHASYVMRDVGLELMLQDGSSFMLAFSSNADVRGVLFGVDAVLVV